ncbi:hypothetical protein ANAPH1_00919 [Anaplasma phagocytophilum]|nr:hypothetical protein ANAPH1_00919 [Anaplasma phagocytophilum]
MHSLAEACMPRYIVAYDSIIIQRSVRLAQGGFSVLAEEYYLCESISRSA